jgi:hypothetical protein
MQISPLEGIRPKTDIVRGNDTDENKDWQVVSAGPVNAREDEQLPAAEHRRRSREDKSGEITKSAAMEDREKPVRTHLHMLVVDAIALANRAI